MGQDHIRYDILAQDALRGVIRKVLERSRQHRPAGRTSFLHHLPDRRAGRAHLAAPEGEISRADDDRRPAPVLGPEVTETPSKSACPSPTCRKSCSSPFNAIRGFYDPSVNFELEFDVRERRLQRIASPTTHQSAARPRPDASCPSPTAPRPLQAARKPRGKEQGRGGRRSDGQADARPTRSRRMSFRSTPSARRPEVNLVAMGDLRRSPRGDARRAPAGREVPASPRKSRRSGSHRCGPVSMARGSRRRARQPRPTGSATKNPLEPDA